MKWSLLLVVMIVIPVFISQDISASEAYNDNGFHCELSTEYTRRKITFSAVPQKLVHRHLCTYFIDKKLSSAQQKIADHKKQLQDIVVQQHAIRIEHLRCLGREINDPPGPNWDQERLTRIKAREEKYKFARRILAQHYDLFGREPVQNPTAQLVDHITRLTAFRNILPPGDRYEELEFTLADMEQELAKRNDIRNPSESMLEVRNRVRKIEEAYKLQAAQAAQSITEEPQPDTEQTGICPGRPRLATP